MNAVRIIKHYRPAHNLKNPNSTPVNNIMVYGIHIYQFT